MVFEGNLFVHLRGKKAPLQICLKAENNISLTQGREQLLAVFMFALSQHHQDRLA